MSKKKLAAAPPPLETAFAVRAWVVDCPHCGQPHDVSERAVLHDFDLQECGEIQVPKGCQNPECTKAFLIIFKL